MRPASIAWIAAPFLLLLHAQDPIQPGDLTSAGPLAGAAAKNFALADQSGRQRNLDSLMGPQGLVLVFFRSADWCIYCKGQLMQLQNDLPVLQRAGLGLAAISYDSPEVLKEFAHRKSITFPLLSDDDSHVIRDYDVADRKYRKGMQVDVDKERLYTSSIGYVPVFRISYPAVFVLNRDHHVKWRFVSEGAELRLTGAALVQELLPGAGDQIRLPVPSSGRVEVIASATNSVISLGNRFSIAVELKIPAGFHVYGPEVGGGYKGLSWQIDPTDCLLIDEAAYAKPELKFMTSTGETLPVYENSIRITRQVIVRPMISAIDPSVFERFCSLCLDRASHIKASGTLRFQACDDRQCYPPQTVQPKWTFQFVKPDRQRSPGELWRELEPQALIR